MDAVYGGLAIIFLIIFLIAFTIMAFIPTIIAMFAHGRPFQAVVVLLLNIASFGGLALLIIPGVVLWMFALVLAIITYNGAKRDNEHRQLMRKLRNLEHRGCHSY